MSLPGGSGRWTSRGWFFLACAALTAMGLAASGAAGSRAAGQPSPTPTPPGITTATVPANGSHRFPPPNSHGGTIPVTNSSDWPLVVTTTSGFGATLTVQAQPGFAVVVVGGTEGCRVPPDQPSVVICRNPGNDSSGVNFSQVDATTLLPASDSVTFPAGWNLVSGPAG
jgi:hypothetical protein